MLTLKLLLTASALCLWGDKAAKPSPSACCTVTPALLSWYMQATPFVTRPITGRREMSLFPVKPGPHKVMYRGLKTMHRRPRSGARRSLCSPRNRTCRSGSRCHAEALPPLGRRWIGSPPTRGLGLSGSWEEIDPIIRCRLS